MALGKQWGVHYDIARYTTDQFNVFGGQASMAYPANSDGGQVGTGRADKAITYRNTAWRMLEVGAQVQFRTTVNDELFDSLGASAQVTVLPGVKFGAAYTRDHVDDSLKGAVRGLDGDPEYAIVGGRVDWRFLGLGVVFARQWNGDLRRVPLLGTGELETVVFDGKGVELYANVKLPTLSVYGGFIDYEPDTQDSLLDPDFRIRYLVTGVQFNVAGNCYLYSEARWADDSIGPVTGDEGFNVLTIGVQYGFSFKGFHRP